MLIKKACNLFLRFGIVGLCLVYVLWGVDWEQFVEALRKFGPVALVCSMAWSFSPYVPLAMRFNWLTKGRAGFLNALKASVFCLGINNIFPAKLGEVAKAFYLRRKTCIPLGQGLGLIFWERFADLNSLLILGLLTAAFMKSLEFLAPLAVVVACLWATVIALKLSPKCRDLLLRLVPGQRLKLLASEALLQLHEPKGAGFYLSLAGYSILFWGMSISVSFLVVFWVAQVDLTYAQALTLFVVATLGFATPSSPGALGVVEAAFVLAMSWFGVGKGEALAVALLFRVITFIPPTLAALYVLAESGLSMRGIRQQSENEL